MHDDDEWVSQRAEEANEASEAVLTASHENDVNWGFYAWGDGPPAAGGGSGGFYWFADLDPMVEFLGGHGAFLFPISGRQDMRVLDAEVRAAVAKLQGGAPEEDVRQSLNRLLKGETQFDWIGRYEDLLTGDGDFPRRLRGQFRQGEKDHASIQTDERTDFDDYLATYGV